MILAAVVAITIKVKDGEEPAVAVFSRTCDSVQTCTPPPVVAPANIKRTDERELLLAGATA